jgi:hypothetical protein
MTGETDGHPDALKIKIIYDGFLNAAQVAHILGELDRLYMVLLTMVETDGPLVESDQARLRISQCNTGQSIELVLVDGVKLVLDPANNALIAGTASLAGVSLTLLIGQVLTKAAKTVAETRKLWHEGTKAKHEGTKAKEEVLKLAEEREGKAREALAELPAITRRTVVEIGQSVINEIEYSQNITYLFVNGDLVLAKDSRPDAGYTSRRRFD